MCKPLILNVGAALVIEFCRASKGSAFLVFLMWQIREWVESVIPIVGDTVI